MTYRINHIHIKSNDPKATADWYVKALNFEILSDEVRPKFGDRFIRCRTEDGGMAVNISGARTGETLGPGDADVHAGLEHFGLDSADLHADIARLTALGAEVAEPPVESAPGTTIAFLRLPGEVRIELIEKK
jgi:lactoylglutathione lyase